jgi:hypothetical protein
MPGEDEGADDGEDRHRLGEAVDRRAPLLAEDEEDGADERPRVADADPPDEVRDVPRPVDRRRVAPDADAPVEEVADAQTKMPAKVSAMRKQIHQPRGARFSVTRAMSWVTSRSVLPGWTRGASPSSRMGSQ